MDRARAKELLPIIQAFADGKNIQYLDHSKRWSDCICGHVSFYADDTYRIKPEPEVIYVRIYSDGSGEFGNVSRSKEEFDTYSYYPSVIKKFIEVIE